MLSVAIIATACGSTVALPEVNEAQVEVEPEESQTSSADSEIADNDTADNQTADDAVSESVAVTEPTGDEAVADDGVPDTDDDAATEVEGALVASDGEPYSLLCDADAPLLGSRADISESGNRIGAGSVDFANGSESTVELPDNGVWVTADPTVTGGWYVVLERGSAVRVSPDGEVTTSAAPAAVPPELDAAGNPRSPFVSHELFDNPIGDSRVVVADDIAAVLSNQTDFYQHAVLGDDLEAAGIEWVDTCTGESGQISIAEPDVIEGISPMLADIDRDGQIEIIVTLSNSEVGARLAAFELDGTSAGESAPIGQGNRWRNQLAVGAFGPRGEVEIIDVRTPHIGGTVQAFQQVQDEETGPSLVQVAASDPRYTSHVIRTRNLSMGIAVDADLNDFPDVLVATANRDAIVAMTRTSDLNAELQGWNIIGERPLDNGLTSNIATQEQSPGRALVAVSDGDTLRIWGR